MLIDTVGAFWLFRHGVKREYKLKLWKSAEGWYCPDFAIPEKKLAVEAKGGWKKDWPRDIAKEQAIGEHGWRTHWVSEEEMRADPKKVRKEVRRFLKG